MKKGGGLSCFLNQISQAAKTENINNEMTRIPIDKIIPNPKNFYGLRDIDSLAEMINISHFIAPLIVIKQENNQYMLICGHRRRAAWQKLLEAGRVTDNTLPCIVRSFEPIKFHDEIISAEEMQDLYLKLDNIGNRHIRTVDEQLREIEDLEPLVKRLYHQAKSNTSTPIGSFRAYFARFLGISETAYQRKISLERLILRAKKAVDDRVFGLSVASELVTMTASQQDQYLNEIKTGTMAEIKAFRQKITKGTCDMPEEPAVSDGKESIKQNEPETHKTDDSLYESNKIQKDQNEPDLQTIKKGKNIAKSEHDSEIKNTPENISIKVKAVPVVFSNPQKEASAWVTNQQLIYYKELKELAKKQSENYAEKDELIAAQWNMRVSALDVQILMINRAK